MDENFYSSCREEALAIYQEYVEMYQFPESDKSIVKICFLNWLNEKICAHKISQGYLNNLDQHYYREKLDTFIPLKQNLDELY